MLVIIAYIFGECQHNCVRMTVEIGAFAAGEGNMLDLHRSIINSGCFGAVISDIVTKSYRKEKIK